jgi:serine/threonine protein kinase
MKCSFPLQKVGGFWLVQKLGEGGFGAVYKAIHEYSEDIEKAVKLLHKSLYDDTSGRASQAERSEKRERWLRRFQREVGITAKLAKESWHIVRIDDVGELPELGLYYVMEYLRGQTLEELLKGNTHALRNTLR